MREFACLRFAAAGILAAFLSLGAGGAARALYDVEPGEIPGKPGRIIRLWPLEGGGPGMAATGKPSVSSTARPTRAVVRFPSLARSTSQTDRPRRWAQYHRLGASDVRRRAALRA